MNEFLDECHLCGHVMASRTPICPKCFGKSDPAARQQLQLAAQDLQLAQESQRAAEAQQRLKDQAEHSKFLVFYFILLAATLLIVALFANGK
jgi:hypothetical protein